ncbi:hypothetical protein FDC58_00145 [Clostridium botulinum]|uniref:CgeB family protein n=1 Tax=unclassified Clostridium TaxID=2614128 RepID=UPI000503B669|nr:MULTISPECIES: glycosyltransferase [unclassified Clostridium]AIY81173.1 glycosyl transferases group 1 family protein [Clostridium botulinum 202F]KAI3347508.1 hypothetical protein CIT17_04460 [Clostridium botulinum]KFX56727.1 hypothetical protein KU41_09845 [Clostridium botulinum]KFX59695.1 hypothetical protein KU40_01525 [Clostridium botulinum]KON14267.1 hypothetical protein ACP50_01790 [Clostridium botulinum]
MKKIIYKLYKKMDNIQIIATVVYYIYNVVMPLLMGENKSYKYNFKKINYIQKKYNVKHYKDIKIAFVCDDMTYDSFKDECNSVFLTPSNWFKVMEEVKPDIFFCESAWNGISKYKDCWRGRIYKNKNILFNNRKDIFNILDYCKKSNIKTVFWNKEDPFYFDNEKNNFSDTALNFDYIFTTCSECIDKYKELGHKNVNTLMFGFSEKIFNPLGSSVKTGEAIFAGSWFRDHPKRCKDMLNTFKLIQEKGIKLKIYDRNYNTSNPLKMFPKELKPIINKGMSFNKLKKIYKQASYAVNINTIKNSETMFARRVFELMACNVCVVSNESVGMRKMFGNNVWFLGDEFNSDFVKEICEQNVQYVMENHTNIKRLKQIYDTIGINYIDDDDSIAIIYDNCEMNLCKEHFESLNYKNKRVFIMQKNKFINIKDKKNFGNIDEFIKDNKFSYFIIFKSTNYRYIDLKKIIVHFSYLDKFVGICNGENKFTLNYSNDYYNCVFKGKYIKVLLSNRKLKFLKYTI